MTTAGLRVDLLLAPVDEALHRVLAACHRRRVTIDNFYYSRSSTSDRIVMDVQLAPARVGLLAAVLEREPLVLRCTTSPLAPVCTPAHSTPSVPTAGEGAS